MRRKYLSDPTEDVRVATETLLADFLREIRDVSLVRRQLEEQAKSRTPAESLRRLDMATDRLPELTLEDSEHAVFIGENDDHSNYDNDSSFKEGPTSEVDDRDTGGMLHQESNDLVVNMFLAWVPGQGVKIDYAAVIEILIQQLDSERQWFFHSFAYVLITSTDDEIQQSIALRWLADFLSFAHEVMVPFTPRLIPAILPNLAHHVTMIQSAAIRTNKLLFNVIQNLPSPVEATPKLEKPPPSRMLRSPTPSATTPRPSTFVKDTSRDVSSPELAPESPTALTIPLQRSRASTTDIYMTPRAAPPAEINPAPPPNSEPGRPHSPVSLTGHPGDTPSTQSPPEDTDPFDYQATVNELTIQFISEFEETRVAALKWLIMLHQKAPKKVGSHTAESEMKLMLIDPCHG